LLPDISTILVMTVNPGFGGQAFIETMLAKIEAATQLVAERAPHVTIEIDGGLKPNNVAAGVRAGARAIVCGSGLFGPEGKSAAIAAMKAGIADGVSHPV
ncbi:MAG: ribulose-phosphate 3-epimerase, partial [Thermoleophilia bacterium]|nr:ribulose-phosphate 3-epimerase [Thermoleophilia bacterium]